MEDDNECPNNPQDLQHSPYLHNPPDYQGPKNLQYSQNRHNYFNFGSKQNVDSNEETTTSSWYLSIYYIQSINLFYQIWDSDENWQESQDNSLRCIL